MRRLWMAVAAVALCVPAAFADDLPDGYWRVSQNIGAVGEGPLALVKVEKKDGKPAVSMAEGTPKNGITVSDLTVDGTPVTLKLDAGGGKFTFEGQLGDKDAKAVYGSLSDGTRTFRASLHAQEAGDKMEAPKTPKTPEQIAEAQKLITAPLMLRRQAAQSKDANEKAELQTKAKEA